jgi:hypothetical protein
MSDQLLVQDTRAMYIKLGSQGKFERECLENQYIRLGYESNQHANCLTGDWPVVFEHWRQFRKDDGSATRAVNEIKKFYTAPPDVVWYTFIYHKLYWCKVSDVVEEIAPGGGRIRRTLPDWPWRSFSLRGRTLHTFDLDGRLTKTASFQGTICDCPHIELLVRTLNEDPSPIAEAAKKALCDLIEAIESAIKKLNPKDFEHLMDLIFRGIGWQRKSVLGKTMKDVDLTLICDYTTGSIAHVQVKSSLGTSEARQCIERLGEYEEARKIVACHTLNARAKEAFIESQIELWDGHIVAKLAVNSGLAEWIINKVL